jgi:ABC-type methionine transport system permease subunit
MVNTWQIEQFSATIDSSYQLGAEETRNCCDICPTAHLAHPVRASTILGFVGAGGLGLYIRSTTQLLDYERTMGIILVVIVLVIASEILSHFARRRFR